MKNAVKNENNCKKEIKLTSFTLSADFYVA